MLKLIFIKLFGWFYYPLRKKQVDFCRTLHIKKETNRLNHLESKSVDRVFYLGITEHSNLGDMAQHYCILNWIKVNYPHYDLVQFESSVVTDRRFNFIKKFSEIYTSSDIIIFQSGYCTQDLGGDHELMHRLIIDAVPNAHILMMPQTIFFQKESNKLITSQCYDKAERMLFLARDMVSYNMAKEMFPHITVLPFPDIVTSLIGTLSFNYKREGVCMCCRNDEEKLYSDEEIAHLKDRLEQVGTLVTVTDTTIKENFKQIRANLKYYIEREIENFSRFQITITDRYHGTIFSLIAGTPVIIIKTNDHKVITGADWFKGVYDDCVYVAKDLNDAYAMCLKMKDKNIQEKIKPYFREAYYTKLKSYFDKL